MADKRSQVSAKIKITVIVVVLSVAVVLGVKSLKAFVKGSVQANISARVKGDKKAPVHITEFIDFECPACAEGARHIKKFMTEHPPTVYLELKYFPLSSHRYGLLSAQYAECAGRQGKFWPFHDYLIERQANWKRLTDATPAFEQIAQDVDMNLEILSQCLKDTSVTESIQKDRQEGDTLGIKSTPTYYINGKMVVGVASLGTELNKYVQEAGH